jgi:putative transcriptional regulator
MRWNLRMKAAENGIWKSTEMRRRLADAGMEISTGKMSALWTGTPTSIRLDDLDVICSVLACSPEAILICEPDVVAARRPERAIRAVAGGNTRTGGGSGNSGDSGPRRSPSGRGRSTPPA